MSTPTLAPAGSSIGSNATVVELESIVTLVALAVAEEDAAPAFAVAVASDCSTGAAAATGATAPSAPSSRAVFRSALGRRSTEAPRS